MDKFFTLLVDKAAHFGLSYFLVHFGYNFRYHIRDGVILSLALGFSKELLDAFYGQVDVGDHIANLMGILLAGFLLKRN